MRDGGRIQGTRLFHLHGEGKSGARIRDAVVVVGISRMRLVVCIRSCGEVSDYRGASIIDHPLHIVHVNVLLI
jgi:hypothetical protein